jgi:branched-chain amino acid transport system permease protein
MQSASVRMRLSMPGMTGFGLELALVAAGYLVVSLFMNTYWMTDFMVFCIFVLAFDLLYGYMGHLSFGVMLYYGTGAYATSLWLSYISQNAFLAIGAGILSALLTAAILGAVAIRTRHAAFALINMAFNEIGFFVVRALLKDYTHGDDGLSCTADPLFGLIDFYNETHAYLLTLFVLLAVYALLKTLTAAPFGVAIRSIKENESRVNFLGYDTMRLKWITFIAASGLAALAGSLFACIQGFVSPEVMSPFGNVNVIFAVLIGGAGFLYGGLAGALIFMLIKNYLPIWSSELAKMVPFNIPQWEMWLGIVLLIIVFACRAGVVGMIKQKFQIRGGLAAAPEEA